jgi:hypothetical protein
MGIFKGVKDQIEIKVVANIDADNGRTIKVPFVITSRKPDWDERKSALKRIDDGDMLDEELVADFLKGWHSLEVADGNQVEYNEENLAELMSWTEYRQALVSGIMKAILGKEALAKNS